MNFVYKVTNTENGKSYIGITSRSTEERWKEHLSRAKNGLRNSRIYAAIRKYGVEKFEVTTIDQVDCEDSVRELEKIISFNLTYILAVIPRVSNC